MDRPVIIAFSAGIVLGGIVAILYLRSQRQSEKVDVNFFFDRDLAPETKPTLTVVPDQP